MSAIVAAAPAAADVVVFDVPLQGQQRVEGNVLAEDKTGAILLEGRDGQRYVIQSSQIRSRQRADEKVPLFDKAQMKTALEEEWGKNFKILQTNNYIIVYSCHSEYAKEASRLFERAFTVFTNFFKTNGLPTEKPRQPMVAIIFASQDEYVAQMRSVLGPLARQSSGVYVMGTNRMYLYNALGGKTGEALAKLGGAINDGFRLMLAEQNIATIIHEAIHQVAFNTGLHDRQSTNPLWLVEGMAMYFEAPKLESKGGWGGVGQLNQERLRDLKGILPVLPAGVVQGMIQHDDILRQSNTASDGYALAWGFTYFLVKTKSKAYCQLLRRIRQRPNLEDYPAAQRKRDLEEVTGKSLDELDAEFRKYMSKLLSK